MELNKWLLTDVKSELEVGRITLGHLDHVFDQMGKWVKQKISG